MRLRSKIPRRPFHPPLYLEAAVVILLATGSAWVAAPILVGLHDVRLCPFVRPYGVPPAELSTGTTISKGWSSRVGTLRSAKG